MEAFLLSYPMVLTPKNDLALLWVDECAFFYFSTMDDLVI